MKYQGIQKQVIKSLYMCKLLKPNFTSSLWAEECKSKAGDKNSTYEKDKWYCAGGMKGRIRNNQDN